jgi:GMP synthase (glutamine-hydrolysing)
LYKDKKILSIQNIEFETLGMFEELFQSDGYQIENINAQSESIPIRGQDYEAIVILGGPMSVYDKPSYIEKEQNLVRDALKTKVPVLGICLGSQIIAQATGGNVYKGRKKEIGWYNVNLNHKVQYDLFKGFKGKTMQVFQWHGDTYDLPSSAAIVASSEFYPQAFKVGTAIGIQFHLEVNYKMIAMWIQEYEEEVSKENINPEHILSNRKRDFDDLYERCKMFYSNFSRMINPNQT